MESIPTHFLATTQPEKITQRMKEILIEGNTKHMENQAGYGAQIRTPVRLDGCI